MRKKQFKAESRRLLDLMINSIYTHREIFLREILSNASDAIDKLCYLSLTDDKVGLNRGDFAITISVDKDARTITVDVKSDWGGYYTFADYSDATKAVVATFDEEGTITFNNWAAWYNGYQYTYEGAESILTKK